ncbi:MAG: hypothetical protein U5K27_04715 [Desulfotignum sp.]|nr:hypothetical protein [Desulfotignum sp.]
MKILCKLILIVATITTGVNFGYAQIDAGFDVTFIVGNEPIDLFDGASTNEGTWSVDGGCLNGSLWDACGYQPFIEPFRDYVATLTNSSNESDSKTIRAYNKLDPSLIPIIPLSICQNSQYNVAPFEFDPPVTYYQSFSKRTFYQINGTGPFIEFTEKVRGSTLGSGNHVIRERYTNVVLSFVYTDIEKQITVRQNPELYWATPIPQL